MRVSVMLCSSSLCAIAIAAVGGTAHAQSGAPDPGAAPATETAQPAAPTPDARAASPDAVASGSTTGDSGEIVVTGSYAQSLKRARDKKRDSPLVIEALSLSDLKQLPDVSVADALSRLPGLAADRDPNNGAKSQISIRGMGAALTLGTLNGRDLATSDPVRAVRYDQFPSELIGSAVVYKSPMASIPEGGVAGSIDLATIHPLDFRETRITGDLRGVYNQLGDQLAANKRFGYRGSASYIGQFADHTIGVAIGLAARKEPYNVLRTQHAGYAQGGYVDFNGDGVNDNATYQLTQTVRSGTDKRQGLVGVVEWKPSPAVHLTIDSLYSKVKLDGKINGVVADQVNQEFANTYTNPVVDGRFLVAGTVTGNASGTYGYDLNVENLAAIARRNDKLYSIGVNLALKPSPNFEANLDAAYSGVRYYADYYQLTTEATTLQNGSLARLPQESITFDARNEVPTFGNLNFDLTDPTINRPANLQLPFLEIGRDDVYSYKADSIYYTGSNFLTALRFGARYVDRTKSNRSLDLNVSLAPADRPILSGAQIGPNALGSYNGAQAGAAPAFMSFNFFDVANQYFGGLHPYEDVRSQTASWDVTERTLAGYAQADFSAGEKLTGNVGVRVIRTRDRSSSVRQIADGSLTPYSVNNNYTDVLPSFNLTYRAGGGLQFRGSIAKTIARPAVEDLNAGFTTYLNNAYGGNPSLQPFRANQADLTAEYYFGKNDFVAFTGFYKDLKTYITTSSQQVTVGETQYTFFQPVNGNGGRIRGFEVTLQKQFDMLPGALDGLGVYANYAFVDSNIRVSRNYTDARLGLIGLSKHTATGTLYYYKSGFDAHVSYNWRSPYASVVDGGSFETTDSAGYLDAQVSYEFRKGMTVLLQGTNLSNTPNRTFLNGTEAERGRYEEFGRVFFAGFRFQL